MPTRDPSLPAAPAGWDVPRFRIDGVLGTGGFATVYRAYDDRLDDTVAIKLLAGNHALDPTLRERFLGEGRVLRRIDSPHVVRVHDVAETGYHQPYLVLEFADRGTLRQRVEQRRAQGWRPDVGDVRSVAEPLARGLAAVHRAEVVHRDVNPANVLLTTRGLGDPDVSSSLVGPDERLMLADLGLCKDLAINTGYTVAGGTEGFRPPELRVGPTVVDETADLWSLSAVVLWLVTGRPPPEGMHPGSIHEAIVTAGLPPALAEALVVGLADDPSRRQRDAATWLAAVAAAWLPSRPAHLMPPSPAWAPLVDAAEVAQLAAHGRPGPAHLAGGAATRRDEAPPNVGTATWVGSGTSLPPPPAAAGSPAPEPVVRDFLASAAWMLWGVLSLGLLAGVGFLYVGMRARRRSWLVAGGACGVAGAVAGTLLGVAPTDADGTVEESWQSTVAGLLILGLIGVALVYGFFVNRSWTRWRLNQRRLRGWQQWTQLRSWPILATDLPEPWNGFVLRAHGAVQRVSQTLWRVAHGPLQMSLMAVAAQLEASLATIDEVARRGSALAAARSQIDLATVDDRLASVQRRLLADGGDRQLTATSASLRAQQDSAARLDAQIADAAERLGLLEARVGEAAAMVLELSVTGTERPSDSEVTRQLDAVVGDVEALRQAVEEVSSLQLRR